MKIEKTGWISPEGKLYECDAWMHDNFAEASLGSSYKELIDNGWIDLTFAPCPIDNVKKHKIENADFSTFHDNDLILAPCINCKSMYVTLEQFNKLKKLGFTEDFLEDECIFCKE